MTEQQATDYLMVCYRLQVEKRHRKFSPDAATKKNIAQLAKALTAEHPKFGILLCGLCGNGKTTLLKAFQFAINTLVADGYLDKNVCPGIRIVDAKVLAQIGRDYKEFEKIATTEMLAIEDMGREPTEVLEYGNITSPVVDLLERRYDEQLFTFITSNLPPKAIREKYGTRVADRCNEMFATIVFENPSYRIS